MTIEESKTILAVAFFITAIAVLEVALPEDSLLEEAEVEAVCETDSDCLLYCPPPNDDPDCDGGPEGIA